jgi:diguanylate cyclase (GGDEF)-like protein
MQKYNKKQYKILIVDDTKANINILLEHLKNNYRITPVLSGKQALKAIKKLKIDLILLDIMMPEMDGFEVCEILKSQPETKDIPIIFITAMGDEETIEKAYDIGGIDYITKPFKPKELLARVKRELHLQELQSKLKFLASTDPMTKLYNRRYFSKVSAHIFDLAKRDKQDLCLVMLDIDKFKNINDTYGHDIGDKVIISLANKLTEYQRKSDVICRFGGEEFIMLLPNTSIDGAKIVAEKLRADVGQSAVLLGNNQELKCTISLGVSQIDMKNETDIKLALKRADDAMYHAKNSGRNRVCIK